MSDLVVSFEPEPGFAPPPTGPAVPRTAPVLLLLLAGLESAGAIGAVWIHFAARGSSVHYDDLGVGRLTQAVAALLFAVALAVLALGVRRGSARARLASFGVAGYQVLSACFGLVGLAELLGFAGTSLWNPDYVLPAVGSWLLLSLPSGVLGVFLFRALAAPALRDHCEPRG